MAAARWPVLRHLLSCQARSLRASNQRRWAQVHDVRFLATTQPPRHVLEKYRDKLDRKAREEGHADIDTLKAAYADKIQALRKQADAVPPPPATPSSPSSASPVAADQDHQRQQPQHHHHHHQLPPPSSSSNQPRKTPTRSGSGTPPLSSILDLPKAQVLPVRELTAIWRFHHAARPNSLCAVIPAATFAAMEALARQHPQFVLPVPVPVRHPPAPGQQQEQQHGGAELHFLQWTWDASNGTTTVLFTQLAEYKARGEFAAPHTTVTHYTDLASEKGVVLMQGSVMEDRGVRVEDARWLVMCLQRFYGGWDGVGGDKARERAEERRRLLEWFGRGDARFSVERLMEEAERMA